MENHSTLAKHWPLDIPLHKTLVFAPEINCSQSPPRIFACHTDSTRPEDQPSCSRSAPTPRNTGASCCPRPSSRPSGLDPTSAWAAGGPPWASAVWGGGGGYRRAHRVKTRDADHRPGRAMPPCTLISPALLNTRKKLLTRRNYCYTIRHRDRWRGKMKKHKKPSGFLPRIHSIEQVTTNTLISSRHYFEWANKRRLEQQELRAAGCWANLLRLLG